MCVILTAGRRGEATLHGSSSFRFCPLYGRSGSAGDAAEEISRLGRAAGGYAATLFHVMAKGRSARPRSGVCAGWVGARSVQLQLGRSVGRSVAPVIASNRGR